MELTNTNKIIIYDGACGFCNKWVLFILDNRPDKDLRFVAFQSSLAKPFLEKHNIDRISSTIFIDKNHCYQKSTAIFKIFGLLNTPWKYLSLFTFIPNIFSDTIYNFIAKNRFGFLNQNVKCRLLNPEEELFFLK